MTQQTPEPEDRFLLEADDLVEGVFREVMLEDDDRTIWLVLTRYRDRARGWLNVCPHAGRALNWAPDKFLTDDQGHLVCASHGAVFEPEAGRCIGGPCLGAALTPIKLAERDRQIMLTGLPNLK